METRPFRVAIPGAEIADLRVRPARTRWSDEIDDADWSYGVRADWLHGVRDHRADGFDWRAQEARINALPQFTARLDGLDTHFIHARAAMARNR